MQDKCNQKVSACMTYSTKMYTCMTYTTNKHIHAWLMQPKSTNLYSKFKPKIHAHLRNWIKKYIPAWRTQPKRIQRSRVRPEPAVSRWRHYQESRSWRWSQHFPGWPLQRRPRTVSTWSTTKRQISLRQHRIKSLSTQHKRINEYQISNIKYQIAVHSASRNQQVSVQSATRHHFSFK